MDFDAVMTEIASGLTDDPEKDIKYLMEQCEKYKDHEMNTEILRAIGRLIAQRIPEEKMKEFDKALDRDMTGHRAMLEEVDFLIYKRDFEKALSLLDPFIEKTKGMFKDDAKSEYHNFTEPFEVNLYKFLMKPEKDIRPASFPFVELYTRKAGILFELGRYEEALENCEAALKWNPMHAGAMFELIENKKMLGDLDSYLHLTQEAFKKVFRPGDLAHCYRNMAYWFVEQELYREAMGCLLISLQFEKNQVAQAELFYIERKADSKIKPPTEKQFQSIAKKYGFPVGPDKDVVGMAYTLGKICLDNNDIGMTRYYWAILNNLVHDENLEKMMEMLPKE